MSRIAPDEVRHAQLAWAVDRWLMTRLGAVPRRRVREARRTAVAQLAHDARHELPSPERDRLGLPNADESLRMLVELERVLGLTATA